MAIIAPFPVSSLLRLMRQFAGMSQVELSAKLGVTQSWLSKLESGTGELGLSQLLAIRQVFGISADALIDGVVPFDQIAARFGHAIAIPTAFAGGNAPMRYAYPLLRALIAARGEPAVVALLRQLEIPTYAVADPKLRLNRRFHVRLLQQCETDGLLKDERAWKKLAEGFEWPLALQGVDCPLEAARELLASLDEPALKHEKRGPRSLELRSGCSGAGDMLYWKYLGGAIGVGAGKQTNGKLEIMDFEYCETNPECCITRLSWA